MSRSQRCNAKLLIDLRRDRISVGLVSFLILTQRRLIQWLIMKTFAGLCNDVDRALAYRAAGYAFETCRRNNMLCTGDYTVYIHVV